MNRRLRPIPARALPLMAIPAYAAAAQLILCLTLHSAAVLPPAAAINVIVLGDSTAADYDDPSLYPLAGWATFLGDHFRSGSGDGAVAVRNLAASGRSSKSFYAEGRWTQAKTKYLSAGDYVFIQFGHNDQKSDSARHTDPFTSYKYYLSIYVNESRAAMATPVLLTSIARAVWDGGSLEQTLGNYPRAMRELAAEQQVALIDLNAATMQLFSSLGETATQNDLFMCLPAGKYPNYPDGIRDTSHLQVAGAKQVADLAAQGIVKSNLPLQAYLT